MNKVLLFLLLLLSSTVHGQYENRSQPDSVYKGMKIKKISRHSQLGMKDASTLTEIIYFDREGHKIRSVSYSEPYDFGKEFVSRGPLRISHYKYDSAMKVIQIIDSIGNLDNSYSIESSYLYYDSLGRLAKSLYYRPHRYTPIQETFHYYSPHKSITVQRNDTLVSYHGTTELERAFYVKSVFGYDRAPKGFYDFQIDEQDTTNHWGKNELYTFNFNKTFVNRFDTRGRLRRSNIIDDFNNKITNYKLKYRYYRYGLLKSIREYVTADYFNNRGYMTTDYFKYEFYK